MARKTVLRTIPDCVTVTPCTDRHQHHSSVFSPVYLGESLGRVEGGDESEGDPGDEGGQTYED